MIFQNDTFRQRFKNTSEEPFWNSSLTNFFSMFLLICLIFFSAAAAEARIIKASILMVSDVRQASVDGLKNGLGAHVTQEGYIHTFSYEIKNAAGNRGKLPEMAAEIIADKPDIAIACGGIEADALLLASAGTNVPVVFLWSLLRLKGE